MNTTNTNNNIIDTARANILANRIKYNNSFNGRAQSAKVSGRRRGSNPEDNNLTGKQIISLLQEQDFYNDGGIVCSCCGTVINSNSRMNIYDLIPSDIADFDFDIAHIDPDGPVTYDNLQILCRNCNIKQRKLVIDFRMLFNKTNWFFRDIWNIGKKGFNREWAIKVYNMSKKDIARFDNHPW